MKIKLSPILAVLLLSLVAPGLAAPPTNCRIAIESRTDNRSPVTNSNLVDLYLLADNVTEMAIRNGVGPLEGAWSGWMPYDLRVARWNLLRGLPDADGTIWVQAKFRNWTEESAPVIDIITLDRSAPADCSIRIFDPDTNSTQLTNSRTVRVTPTATGASQVRFRNGQEDPSRWWDFRGEDFSWRLSEGPDGPRTMFAQFQDTAGNVSREVSASITLDATPPTGNITINRGAANTTKEDVTLTIDASGATEMTFTNDFEFIGAAATPIFPMWESYRPSKKWVLLPGEGERCVYAKFRDDALNESEIVMARIILDKTPPSGTIWINNRRDVSTNNRLVQLTLFSGRSNDIFEMRISNNQFHVTSKDPRWQPYSPILFWTLTPGNGLKWVHAQFRDEAGNRSAVEKDSILLDTTRPER